MRTQPEILWVPFFAKHAIFSAVGQRRHKPLTTMLVDSSFSWKAGFVVRTFKFWIIEDMLEVRLWFSAYYSQDPTIAAWLWDVVDTRLHKKQLSKLARAKDQYFSQAKEDHIFIRDPSQVLNYCVSVNFSLGTSGNHKFYAWDSVSVTQFVFLSSLYDLFCTSVG